MLEPLGLGPLGLGPDDERLYRSLLPRPGVSARDVADATGQPLVRVRATLGRLVSMRLVQRQPGKPAGYVATPPDIAITALVNERQAELDQARLAVPELLAEYHQAAATNRPGSVLEVVTGPDVGQKRFRQVQAAATTELLIFDRVSDRRVTGEPEVLAEAPMLSRGVRCRAIYESSSLDIPGRLPHIRRLALLGEVARVAPKLPMKLAICDRRLAMVPLSTAEDRSSESVVMVGPSDLLDALVEVFESYWRSSVPIRSGAHGSARSSAHGSPGGAARGSSRGGATPLVAGGLTPEQHEVLDLLTTGLKDEAIARQLGTSMRTTRRRIAGLLATLGVATRFQAGVEATRRGLL